MAVSPMRIRPDKLLLFFPATIPGIPALNLTGGTSAKLLILTNTPAFSDGPALTPW